MMAVLPTSMILRDISLHSGSQPTTERMPLTNDVSEILEVTS